MALLRAEQERMQKDLPDKKKKESKKDKRRRNAEDSEEGRKKKSPRRDEEELEVGQKPLEWIFKGTGMDPDPRRRAKLMRKARKVAKKGKKKKKKDKGSSEGSSSSKSTSSSSSSPGEGEEGLFDEELRVHSIWRRYPGTLTAKSLQEIKRNLLTATGTVWSLEKSVLPPLYTQYARQAVLPSMSPALQQEALTLCQALDYFVMGRIAGGMDILNQRLKSVVSLSKGAHWSLGRQYELVKVEDRGFAEEGEFLSAAKRAREDEKIKGLMSRPPQGKGAEGSQGGKNRKGKEGKSTGKGQPLESGKNRGGGGSKEEGKGQWQKK